MTAAPAPPDPSPEPPVPFPAPPISRPVPPVSPESEPFWEATRSRRLLVQWCAGCDRAVQFPRAICPVCRASALEWREASGRGVVHALTVEHRPELMGMSEPYAVALVDLDEGARLMGNVVGCPPASVRIGTPVLVVWEPLGDGRHLPQFSIGADAFAAPTAETS